MRSVLWQVNADKRAFSLLAATVLLFLLGVSAKAELERSDHSVLVSLEKDFLDLGVDLRQNLHGIQDLAGVEYACIDSTFRGAQQMSDLFAQYKFSVGITDIIVDQNDRANAKRILKIATQLMITDIKIVRERINGALAACSRFPLAVAKGTELLRIMKKADSEVQSILGRI